MSLRAQSILITGASTGIGRAIAQACAKAGANLILCCRSLDDLEAAAREMSRASTGLDALCLQADVAVFEDINDAVKEAVREFKQIDVLVNLAPPFGSPNGFADLSLEQIVGMTGTSVNGYMFAAYAVLNAGGMRRRKAGTILNVTSTGGLDAPAYPGEAVYQTSKAAQEAFSEALRTELQDTNIKVLCLRPGVVAANFHRRDSLDGFDAREAEEVAEAAVFMLGSSERICVKTMDIVPTLQRDLQIFGSDWNSRQRH